MNITVTHTWPENLPLPSEETSGTIQTSTLASPIEQGAIKRRSRFKSNFYPMTVRWTLQPSQRDAFEEFYEATLGNGTSAFSIELKYPQRELTAWLVRFTSDGFKEMPMDGLWRIEAEFLLIRPVLLPGSGVAQPSEGETFLVTEGSFLVAEGGPLLVI